MSSGNIKKEESEGNQRIDQANERSQSSSENKGKKYYTFLSMMINPNLIQNPQNNNQNASRDLFSQKGIREIRRYRDYLHLSVFQKKGWKKESEEVLQRRNFSNQQFQNQLNQTAEELKANLSLYHERVGHLNTQNFSNYLKMLDKNYDKPFMAMFTPLRAKSPKLKGITFSKKLLNIIGYQMDDAPTEVQKYEELAFDFLDGNIYKQIFLDYTRTFRKYVSMQLRGNITHQKIIEESTIFLENTIKGRRQVRLMMKLTIPHPYMIMFEITDIFNINQKEDDRLEKRAKLNRCEIKSYNTLHNITKLPSVILPQNALKVCDYRFIGSLDGNVKFEEDDNFNLWRKDKSISEKEKEELNKKNLQSNKDNQSLAKPNEDQNKDFPYF